MVGYGRGELMGERGKETGRDLVRGGGRRVVQGIEVEMTVVMMRLVVGGRRVRKRAGLSSPKCCGG
jgi:hypothetical protein